MNLFVTDESPYQSAYNLPDKLVVKMSLETCQMLAACFSEEFLNYGTLSKKDGTPYKSTHKNHPCTKWIRESDANVAWAIVHGLALCAEYHRRYGKIHSCLRALLDAKKALERQGGSLEDWKNHTPFVRAMPDEFKLNRDIDTVEAYREYIHTKSYAEWKFCEPPNWWAYPVY
jgi:hypothetical protein